MIFEFIQDKEKLRPVSRGARYVIDFEKLFSKA